MSQGRPAGYRKQLEKIRGRILRILNRRILKDKNLESVSTADLIKFAERLLPKNYNVGVAPLLPYASPIDRTPLPATDAKEITEQIKKENKSHETRGEDESSINADTSTETSP